MKKEELKQLIKEVIVEEKMDSKLLKEDFIAGFISSLIKRLKSKELARIANASKNSDPEFYAELERWKKKNKALFDQIWNEIPKKSKPAGPMPKK